MRQDSPHSIDAHTAPGSSQVIFYGFGDKALLIFLMFVAAVALILSVLAWGISSRAADRADIAERRANISELYAKQVFVELNRLGYPVKTPAEEHSVAPVEEP